MITQEQFEKVLASAGASPPPKPGGGGADDKLGREALETLVGLIPNDLTMDRDQWIAVGHGLKALAESDDEGFEVFDAWSQTWEGGYDGAETRRAWDSFGASGLKARGGALRQRAANADPDGFDRWTQAQTAQAFDDGGEAGANAATLAAGAGVHFHLDQQKSAREVLEHLGGRIKRIDGGDWRAFDPTTGRWRGWPGNHALRVVEELVHERKRRPLDKGLRTKLGTKDFLSGVATLVAINGEVEASEIDFDQQPLLLGVPSGVVDLSPKGSRDIRLGALDERVSKTTAVDPAPKGTPHPVWSRFLAEFTQGDAALEEWLQCYCGYALTGLTREHLMPFFFGSGGNGKSVFLNVIRGVWGEYGATIDSRLMFEKLGGFHLAPLAALAGVRLGVLADVAPGAVWDTQMLKTLTGGDFVTANHMHRDPFTFMPAAKLMISGNDMPGVRSMDDGIRRRMRMLPMKAKPKVIDLRLPDRLREEWPAILRWALTGLDLYWGHGVLPSSKAIEDETRDYLETQDPFGRWVVECLRADPTSTAKIRGADLFRSWDAYRCAEGQNGAKPRDGAALSRALGVKGIVTSRDNQGAYLTGYRLIKVDEVNPF